MEDILRPAGWRHSGRPWTGLLAVAAAMASPCAVAGPAGTEPVRFDLRLSSVDAQAEPAGPRKPGPGRLGRLPAGRLLLRPALEDGGEPAAPAVDAALPPGPPASRPMRDEAPARIGMPDREAAHPSEAPPGAPARETITLNVSRGQTVWLPRPATSIFVADPAIADIQTPSDQAVFVFGKKPGRTSLFALDESGMMIAEHTVVITPPLEDLRSLLRSEIGDYDIRVSFTRNGAVLSGQLPNAGLVESAKSITAQFLGPGALVTNRLRIMGALQVNLQVRVAEIDRRVFKRFGINLSAGSRAGGAGFNLVSGGGAGSSATQAGSFSSRIGVSYSDGVNSISANLDALAQHGLASILAEPNLTAISGEKARFLAGGEFAVPVAQALGQTSVVFRHFGASLEFEPTVLSNNLINIRVRPEVSELSAANGVQFNGTSIPGLSTRSADTVVELADGQSFAIGGLIRKNFSTDIGVMPGLGNLPILGALFRSSAFQKDETELVIIVTPYIVRSGRSPRQLDAPSDRVSPPDDAERILLNTLARPAPPRPGAADGQGLNAGLADP